MGRLGGTGAGGGENFLYSAFEQFDLAVSGSYHSDLYLPLYNLTQDFIAGNEQLLALINQPFVDLFGRDLIGNGVDGFTGSNDSLFGSTGWFGDLGDGGFLFGDGGAGTDGWPGSWAAPVVSAGTPACSAMVASVVRASRAAMAAPAAWVAGCSVMVVPVAWAGLRSMPCWPAVMVAPVAMSRA